MLLTEPIESINKQLVDLFGIDTISGIPIWRVVWSEDQFEKRLGTYEDFTPSGIYLRTVTEVREAPKYRQWIREKYVLERLCVIPMLNEQELPDTKVSYEPIFVFEDVNGNYLPPKLIVCKFTIDGIYDIQFGTKNMVKYVEPDDNREERVNDLMEAIYGDETEISDALTRKDGIVVPSNYKKGH